MDPMRHVGQVTQAGVHIRDIRSGQHFGEIAIVNKIVRTASVQAVTFCQLLVLGRTAFDRQSPF
jgi:CRP-like cAMP-binding protein